MSLGVGEEVKSKKWVLNVTSALKIWAYLVHFMKQRFVQKIWPGTPLYMGSVGEMVEKGHFSLFFHLINFKPNVQGGSSRLLS